MSSKSPAIFDYRLSANVSQQMNSRLDTLADLRNMPKAELVREALRFWLDHQEDAQMSRQFFTKSFQRRIDYLDWQLEVLMHMLISLANKRPDLLEEAIQAALQTNLGDMLQQGALRRATQNRKPPED